MAEKKISHEKLQKALNWTPHEGQKKVINNKHRERILCAGRRFGKSQLCAYEVVYVALQPNKRIWISAPSYELTKIVFDQAMMWLYKLLPKEGINVKRKPFPKIKLKNGTVIEGKSCEARTGLLGRSTDLVIIDEAARVDEEIWTQYIKPTTHERKGRVIYISTPTGINWFYDKFLELKPQKSAYHFTSKDNPYFDEEEWDKAKKSLPDKVFRQEYEAEFLTEGGLVFRNIEDSIDGECLEEPQDGSTYVLGLDIARHNDFTGIVVMNRATKKVAYMDRFNELDFHYQKERILTCAKKYNNAKIIIDSTGMGDSVASDLKRHALVEEYPLYSQKAKQRLIDKLIIFLDQNVIKIPDNDTLVNELKRYEVKMSRNNNSYVYSAPRGEHDDMVIALALAVWGLRPNRIENDEDDEDRGITIMNDYE